MSTGTALHAPENACLPASQMMLTPEMLHEKLQLLLHQMTCNIALEVRKHSQELCGEITQIDECTDALKMKFDELVQCVQALEEEKSTLKHTISQLQLQQEDLENRKWCQNLHIREVSESVDDNNLRPYLLGLFNTLAPTIADIDWHLDHA